MRVLFALAGSAGDVLPLLEFAADLQQRGETVHVAHPRFVDPSSYQLPHTVIGNGRELLAAGDPAIVSNSQADVLRARVHLLDEHLAPHLVLRGRMLLRVGTEVAPDVIVAHESSFEAFVVAAVLGRPLLAIHFQPDIAELGRAFRRSLVPGECAKLAKFANQGGIVPKLLSTYPLGQRDVLLSDPVLLGEPAVAVGAHNVTAIGALPHRPGPAAPRIMWGQGPGPRVLIALGTSVGAHLGPRVIDWAQSLQARARVVAVVGAGLSRQLQAENVAYLPWANLSEAAGEADVVIHHAGIGTAAAVVRTSTPSVVCPQMFDQHRTASQLVRARLAVALGQGSVVDACDLAMNLDPLVLRRARTSMIPAEEVLRVLRGELDRALSSWPRPSMETN